METGDRPTWVDIGPHRYTIHWDQAAIDRERVKEESPGLRGHIRYGENKIVIDPTMAPSHQRRTLLHELLHGILDVTGWTSVAPEKPDCDDFLVRIDSMLLDTMRRNPHVVAWLLSPDDA